MSDGDVKGAELSMRPPAALEEFIDYLRGIAPHPERQITPQSHFVDDLGFDAIAFSCLGLLVAERYGIGGVSTTSLQSENLTVEAFFEKCILHVLGVGPDR
jgi:acyl carrier protein